MSDLFAGASDRTMAQCLAAKDAENIPLHPEVADLETGAKLQIIPHKFDPRKTQQWALAMMQGKESPLYVAFQPGAQGGKMDPSERKVTFEEVLIRQADRSQQFPVIVAMHLTKHQRYLLKVWEMHICDERRALYSAPKNFNMLPDDIVEMTDLLILLLGGKDHVVEWQEFKPPASPSEYPKKILGLEQSHFGAMDALTAGGVNQALDDVSIAQVDKSFSPDGHPYTPDVCSRDEIKRNIKQLKLDLKDGVVIYQQAPVLTNPAGQVAFKKALEVSPEFIAQVAEGAEKLMKDFGGHFTVEGSFQDQEGAFTNCDFQGCETNDWAEGVPATSAATAFAKMTNFLESVVENESTEPTLKSLVQELLNELKAWEFQQLEVSDPS